MTDALLPGILVGSILLVSILTLAGTILSLRSSRRLGALGEDRNELLRDQWDRLEFLQDERQMLIDELERQSRERQLLVEFLGKTPPQLVEDLKKERRNYLKAQERIEDLKQERLRLEQELYQLKEQVEQEHRGHVESLRRAELLELQQKEQSGIQEELERLGQEHQHLTEDLKREREQRLRAQRQADKQEQERTRLEGEVRSLRAELERQRRVPARDPVKASEASHPWWRRRALVVGLLIGALILWLTSLMVALYLASP